MKKSSTTSEHSQSSAPSVNAMCAEVALRNYLAGNLHKLLSGKGDAFPSGSLATIIEKETACGLLLEACKAGLVFVQDAADNHYLGSHAVCEQVKAAITAAQGNSGSGD